MFSSPFSGTFFQSPSFPDESGKHHNVFVPFLEDFFSMKSDRPTFQCLLLGFRPLSRGLFFNSRRIDERNSSVCCFRPLSWGLSFNKFYDACIHADYFRFRPLSWGLSFNQNGYHYGGTGGNGFRPLSWGLSFNGKITAEKPIKVGDAFSSPFLGTFFQLIKRESVNRAN